MPKMMAVAVIALLVVVVSAAAFWLAQIGAFPVPGWLTAKEVASTGDLPWAAPGQTARRYAVKAWDFNKGASGDRRWGSGRLDLQSPVDIAYQAFAYLEKRRAMTAWPPALPGGSGTFHTYSVYDELLPGDQHEKDSYGNVVVTYTKRVAPYRFFLVSIQPTVVVMQHAPELPDLWRQHVASEFARDSRWTRLLASLPADQQLDTIWLQNPIEFGTALPAGDRWRWFSPELNQLPTAVPLARDSATTIPIGSGQLRFEPIATGWRVLRE